MPASRGIMRFAQFFAERGVQLRIAALCFSATEAVFLKKAILHSDPVTAFVYWSILGLPVAAAAVVLMHDDLAAEIVLLRRHRVTYLWLALATGTMQLTTLLTFGKLQVGYSLALVSTLDPDRRVPGLSIFPRRADPQAIARGGDYVRRRRADRIAGAARLT